MVVEPHTTFHSGQQQRLPITQKRWKFRLFNVNSWNRNITKLNYFRLFWNWKRSIH